MDKVIAKKKWGSGRSSLQIILLDLSLYFWQRFVKMLHPIITRCLLFCPQMNVPFDGLTKASGTPWALEGKNQLACVFPSSTVNYVLITVPTPAPSPLVERKDCPAGYHVGTILWDSSLIHFLQREPTWPSSGFNFENKSQTSIWNQVFI